MDVAKVQTELNNRGFGPLIVDGKNGPATIAAVKRFQQSINIDVDGIVGPDTLLHLFPQSTPTATSLNELALEIAISQNGVREATGANDGPQVEAYLASVGLPAGYSWCMAFVYWCYKQAAKQLGITNPLIATGGVFAQYNQTSLPKPAVPQRGDIFIINEGGGHGHTGIVVGVRSGVIDTIEGNTNNNGSSNGNGVYLRTRGRSQIYGYIRP